MNKLVTVKTFPDYFSAHLMLQTLEHEGIRAMLVNESSGTLLPHMKMVGIKLQVLEQDVATALRIIEEIENQNIEPSE
ncbi:MAG TPA: DUF2007 domain-containing protein [Edaphocola sp.]|nr:DUF2007 domain-containing protein [Edaphocola sp.]